MAETVLDFVKFDRVVFAMRCVFWADTTNLVANTRLPTFNTPSIAQSRVPCVFDGVQHGDHPPHDGGSEHRMV